MPGFPLIYELRPLHMFIFYEEALLTLADALVPAENRAPDSDRL